MLEYEVTARRVDAHGAIARTKAAELVLDTDLKGRPDAFNPAELFLASIAACMIKGIERVAPILAFQLEDVDVRLRATRQDAPPMILRVHYVLTVATEESDQRLALLHTNVRKHGTIFNTVSHATALEGEIRRAAK